MDATTLDRFGRVLLPLPVRRSLGLKAGDRLRLRVEKGAVVLRADVPEGRWETRDGIPVWTGPMGDFDVVKVIDEARDERLLRFLGKAPGP
jgi:AbrB family looped-hinge helix DNA binding protein